MPKVIFLISLCSSLLLFGSMTTVSQNHFQKFSTLLFPHYENLIVNFSYSNYPNFLKFLSFSFLIVVHLYQVHTGVTNQVMPKPKTRIEIFSLNPYLFILLPSVCSVVAFYLLALSLDFGVPSSIYQMLRGSIIIFTPITARVLLKRKPKKIQITAICTSFVGLAVVALASYFQSIYFAERSTKSVNTFSVILGILFIFIGEAVYSLQYVFEEILIKNMFCTQFQIIGFEGVYGLIITLAFAMPIESLSSGRSQFDAFVFSFAESMIIISQFVFFICMTTQVFIGQKITQYLSSSHRAILQNLNSLFVWIFSLIERLIFGAPFGEPAYGWVSWIQVGGFAINMVGVLVFYEVLKFSFGKKSEME